MPNKILYFNGCSWAEGAELNNMEEDRCSSLLSKKLGYKEINKGGSGKSHDEIIKETLLYAYKNKDNSDNIIINVMLTSPERILMYCNDKAMVFNWWLIMDTGAPHGASKFKDWRFDEQHATFDLARLWSAYFHNLDFYIDRYLKDILLLNNTLETLGYNFVLANAFYNFNTKPDEPNLPFYEESTTSGPDVKYSGKSHSWKKSLGHYDLFDSVFKKISKKNLLYDLNTFFHVKGKNAIEHSIKDALVDLWGDRKKDYLNIYDIEKLSSILTYEGETNYFFCENGHPSELGNMKMADLFYRHYKNHEYI